jgi:hypothetical protein
MLHSALAAYPRIEVVEFTVEGVDALAKIKAHRPDVVTLDVKMPHLNGSGSGMRGGAGAGVYSNCLMAKARRQCSSPNNHQRPNASLRHRHPGTLARNPKLQLMQHAG